MTYTAPHFDGEAFHCPHCETFAHMTWAGLYGPNQGSFTPISRARCARCNRASYWFQESMDGEGEMLHPHATNAPHAHPDMPASCLPDFEEARTIAIRSPRGAAALLRLCIQKLCIALGQSENTIDSAIQALVTKGLPATVQQAMDTVRVTGNEAVHPGTMSADDHADRVNMLFGLVNLVVQRMITDPKEVEELYAKLPAGKLKSIENRDKREN